MKALLLDFLRRWWWVLLICLAGSALSVVAGKPIIIAPVAAVLILMDANQGWTRAVRCLPVRLQDQVRFCWIAGVFLIPIASVLALALCGMVRMILFPAAPSILFGMAVQVWVGLGYAAMCFAIIPYLATRPATGWRQNLKASVLGGAWGLGLAGTGALLPHLPVHPQQLATWHWVILALSPVAVLASHSAASQLVRNRSTPPPSLRDAELPSRKVPLERKRLEGVPLFLATIPGRAVVMTAVIYLIQTAVLISINGSGKHSFPPIAAIQSLTIGIAFASLSVGWSGIRAMRVLPLRTNQLAALLLSPSLAIAGLAFLIGGLANASGAIDLHPLDPLSAGVCTLGMGALGVAAVLRYGKYGVLLPIAMAVVLSATTWILGSYKIPLWATAAPAGLLLSLMGYLATKRLLRQHSESYQEIRYKGAAWQAQNP